MLAVSGHFLAYLVNERKVRIFNTETGQKCSIDRANGVIVGLAWSDELGQPGKTFLAVLAEDGEITIGRISPDEADENDSSLSFEVTSILSFPEVGRARAISWNCGGEIGGKKHLAVHGSASSDVFFVHCSAMINGKSSFINTSIQDIKNVSLLESGACCVSGQDGSIEMFHYSGSSYQSKCSLKLDATHLDAIKVIEYQDFTYCLTISENVLSIFLLNRFDCDSNPIRVASLKLEKGASEFIFNEETKSLLLFSNGQSHVQIVSLAKMSSPLLIPHNLNSKSSIILDTIFDAKKCSQSGETVILSVLFYFADSICCQETSFELELEESEYEEPTQDENEISETEFVEQINQISPFNLPQNPETTASSLIDLDSLRTEIKLIVREAVKESLTEVIHEALNAGIRAGFSQISEDLMNLTRNLVNSVEVDTGMISAANVPSSQDDETYLVKNLISQGHLGMALRKAASMNNSRLLLEVCQKFEDPFITLDEEQLPQETLTQMFALLSLDIDEDTEVKLDWLQEILIQIDFDSEIVESPKLSEQVDHLFDELKSLVNDSLVDGNLQKKMKTVMRLLRKFQMN